MPHVVLLGDSIFDNARYVPQRPAVIDQLRRALPSEWRATLLAVDGHVTEDVPSQLRELPDDATHLIVSAGGNNALSESGVLDETVSTVAQALALFDDARERFRLAYRAMLNALAALGRPTAVCTVYSAIPGLGAAERSALAGFNEVILYEAIAVGLPIIDLRIVCNQRGDFSHISPIEPSAIGGGKIIRAIKALLMSHDFSVARSVVYT